MLRGRGNGGFRGGRGRGGYNSRGGSRGGRGGSFRGRGGRGGRGRRGGRGGREPDRRTALPAALMKELEDQGFEVPTRSNFSRGGRGGRNRGGNAPQPYNSRGALEDEDESDGLLEEEAEMAGRPIGEAPPPADDGIEKELRYLEKKLKIKRGSDTKKGSTFFKELEEDNLAEIHDLLDNLESHTLSQSDSEAEDEKAEAAGDKEADPYPSLGVIDITKPIPEHVKKMLAEEQDSETEEEEEEEEEGDEEEEVDEEDAQRKRVSWKRELEESRELSAEEDEDEDEDEADVPESGSEEGDEALDEQSEGESDEGEVEEEQKDEEKEDGPSSKRRKLEHANKDVEPPAKKQRDLYCQGDVKRDEGVGRYVPPALRNSSEASHLRRQVQGIVNRMAESNMDVVGNQARALFTDHSRHEVTEVLADVLLHVCAQQPGQSSPVVATAAALISFLHALVGVEIGSGFVERLCRLFKQRREEDEEVAASNLLLLIVRLYNFQMLSSKMMFELITLLAESFSELDIELLLLMLDNCGLQLRKDDPAALKEAILLVQNRASQSRTQNKTKDAQASTDEPFGGYSRVQFVLDRLTDIKNNKKRAQDLDTALKPLKNWLRTAIVVAKKQIDRTLPVGWKDIMDIEQKGRWWIVGSSYRPGERERPAKPFSGQGAETIEGEANLASLASTHHMNTQLRQTIFASIMGAEDCADAFEKLTKANHKGMHNREIATVLIYCCGQEASHNPYYSFLAERLCVWSREFRFNLQLAFWDSFKLFSTMPPRRAANLARLLAYVLQRGVMRLSVLKPVDLVRLPTAGLVFFRMLFTTLLFTTDDKHIQPVFSMVAGKSGANTPLAESIMWFLTRHISPSIASQPPELAKQYKRNLLTAKQAMISREAN